MSHFARRVTKRGVVTQMMAAVPVFYLLGCIDLDESDGYYGILMLVEVLARLKSGHQMGRSLVAAQMWNTLSELAGPPWQFHVPFGPPFDRVIRSCDG